MPRPELWQPHFTLILSHLPRGSPDNPSILEVIHSPGISCLFYAVLNSLLVRTISHLISRGYRYLDAISRTVIHLGQTKTIKPFTSLQAFSLLRSI